MANYFGTGNITNQELVELRRNGIFLDDAMRLATMREKVQAGQYVGDDTSETSLAEQERLRFVKWLVDTGRLVK